MLPQLPRLDALYPGDTSFRRPFGRRDLRAAVTEAATSSAAGHGGQDEATSWSGWRFCRARDEGRAGENVRVYNPKGKLPNAWERLADARRLVRARNYGAARCRGEEPFDATLV